MFRGPEKGLLSPLRSKQRVRRGPHSDASCCMPSTNMLPSAVGTSERAAARPRSSKGNDSTHWRKGTSGATWSITKAAVLHILRPAQLGQRPRLPQENGTSKS